MKHPAGIAAKCSLAKPCPNRSTISKAKLCNARATARYGTTNLYDCNTRACVASARNAAFYNYSAFHDFKLAVPGIAATAVAKIESKAKLVPAFRQEKANESLDCATVQHGGWPSTSAYEYDHTYGLLERKRGSKITITFSRGGRKAPKSIVKKLLFRFANKIQVDGRVSYKGLRLTAKISATGKVSGKIAKR